MIPYSMDYMRRQLRVCIYARVSTEHEAQISTLENQLDWYKPLLDYHPEWTLVERYIDEGITGTSAEKRGEFMRMMPSLSIPARKKARMFRNLLSKLTLAKSWSRKTDLIGIFASMAIRTSLCIVNWKENADLLRKLW